MSNLPITPPAGFDEELLQKLISQHSSHQQMWLSGFLYGVALHGSPRAEQTAVPANVRATAQDTVTVLFGSQTGNSKKAAQQLATRFRDHGLEVRVEDLNDYPVKKLRQEKFVVLAVSTQGEGEPPASAEEFHRWLLGDRAPRLEQLHYAVCALGDKSYLRFCQTGKDFDERLAQLGATRIAPRLDCDVEFEEAVEGWSEIVLQRLPVLRPMQVAVRPASVAQKKTAADYSRKRPFSAPLLEKTRLNSRGSEKETWHLELSLEGSGLHYQPGDALGIYPKNAAALVEELIKTGGWNPDKTLNVNGLEISLHEYLTSHAELTVLSRELLENYADRLGNRQLADLVAEPGKLQAYLYGRDVVDLFREFPAGIPESDLPELLRKLTPRLYSIASSLLAHPDEVHLTVSAVRYHLHERTHVGAASTFLADQLQPGQSVPVFVERNEYFKLPENDDADIILIGAGTGVAPFRAFVEERAERGARGRNWLFFGNPHFETDFLYQTEWLNYLKQGMLDRLSVAFSRDQAEKIYVQHRLLEHSRQVFDRLENGASLYVCGDKNRLSQSIQNAVVQIVQKESGQDFAHAEAYLKNLKKQRRYLEDVY